jgi:hypothetical protein
MFAASMLPDRHRTKNAEANELSRFASAPEKAKRGRFA